MIKEEGIIKKIGSAKKGHWRIKNVTKNESNIIELITKNDRIPLNDIANTLTVSKRTILRDIKKMKNGKILERIGSEKNGYWRINVQSLS